MTGIVLCGSWRVTVTRKDSDWAQRVVVTGGVDAVIPGVVGAAATISGDRWDLTVEHDPGCGWRPSAYVAADPVREHAGHATRTVMSKDHYWRGDSDPNDLVLRLEHAGAHLAVACAPQVVGRFLAVTVRNTGFRTFGYDSVLDVTDAGRSVLARWGVVLAEHWEPSALRETGQEAYGRAVLLRPLEVGDEGHGAFPAAVRRAAGPYESAEVEFALTVTAGSPAYATSRAPWTSGAPPYRCSPAASRGRVRRLPRAGRPDPRRPARQLTDPRRAGS